MDVRDVASDAGSADEDVAELDGVASADGAHVAGGDAGTGPVPLGVDPPEPSGDPEVDRAVARLTQVDVLPTDRHGEVYEDVHRELREVLTGLDR
ncbi:hypothetical protein LO772_25705 [Yinghuangia sp. ASG 101]|uniref:hypothetical protein n=1 Tax=Yinghuangia sp. ASG 101 TaxID=2896848 RepID=UPI001E597FD9|nr:hypothetical protein [Yinghuangia sp. ASG 101]UGQ15703.1 hypothetical protein LO772_25705 [Yinghuangia sp. ASG 101]